MSTERSEVVTMVARIGTGDKLHPVQVTRTIKDEGKPWARESFSGLRFVCCCPGTCSGSASPRATVLRGTTIADRTCQVIA